MGRTERIMCLWLQPNATQSSALIATLGSIVALQHATQWVREWPLETVTSCTEGDETLALVVWVWRSRVVNEIGLDLEMLEDEWWERQTRSMLAPGKTLNQGIAEGAKKTANGHAAKNKHSL